LPHVKQQNFLLQEKERKILNDLVAEDLDSHAFEISAKKNESQLNELNSNRSARTGISYSKNTRVPLANLNPRRQSAN
jgi:hypothetical protein